MASIIVATILGGCNIFNDCEDIEIDRINKPYRPLPKGQASKHIAYCVAYYLIALGLTSSLFLGFSCSLIALICSSLGLLYSRYLKNTILIGNITVSLLSASTVLYGGGLEGNTLELLIVSTIIFVFMLAREILKLIDDYEGDQAKNMKTLATIYGQRTSLVFSSVLFAAYLILSIIPFWTLSLSIWYLIITIGVINLKLTALYIQLWQSLTPSAVRIALRMTKSDFYVWCIALLFGKILPHP